MTTEPLLICKHPGCWFELPATAFPADARNHGRHGRATRCHDCESARDRNDGKAPRPGSKAAEVADLKASGLFAQHNPETWKAARAAKAREDRLAADRARSERDEAAYLPTRWKHRVRTAENEQAKWGTASRESRKLLERWAPMLGLEVPEHLWVEKRPTRF